MCICVWICVPFLYSILEGQERAVESPGPGVIGSYDLLLMT